MSRNDSDTAAPGGISSARSATPAADRAGVAAATLGGAGTEAAPAAGAGATGRTIEPQKPEPESWAEFLDRDARLAVPLESWATAVVPDADLWRALREAVAEVLGLEFTPGPQATPMRRLGIVVAEHPMLALAAAAVLLPQARLLQPARERHKSRQRLQHALSADSDLRRFLHRCRRQAAAPGGWVMCSWDQGDLQTSGEAVLADPANRHVVDEGVLCLQHERHVDIDGRDAWGAEVALPVLADLSHNWMAVLSRVLCRLPLPLDIKERHCADLESAHVLISQLLSMGIDGEQLLHDLNTPQFADFQRRVHRLHAADALPQHELFQRFVLDEQDSHPRHAASLFLAAHFDELTPRQFIELGDLLVTATPTAKPARDARRDPPEITDRVLADCQVRFMRTKQGGAAVGLAMASDTGPRQVERLNLGAAEALCALFEREAPLLKERYLDCMSANQLFGHPSDAVAERYLRLEVDALRTATAGEGYTAGERLRRIVYGTPTAASRTTYLHALEQAIARAPRLLAAYAGDDDQRLHYALTDLCTSPAGVTGEAVPALVLWAMSGVFWATYAALPDRVGLRAFPAFFSDQVADAAQRRDDALALLRWILGAPAAESSLPPMGPPATGLAERLMADTLRCFDDILARAPRALDIAMVVEAALAHLEWHARGVPWSTRPSWSVLAGATASAAVADKDGSPRAAPLDLLLARIVCGPRWVGWLLNPEARQGASERQPGQRSLDDEGLLQLRIVRAVIDAWIGLTAFERWEAAALDAWLRKALEDTAVTIERPRFYDRWLWHCMMSTRQDLENDEAGEVVQLTRAAVQAVMRQAAEPLLDSFGLLLLMVVTHQPATSAGQSPRFVFSEALAKWLSRCEPPARTSPAQDFLRTLDTQVAAFQSQWQEALRGLGNARELDVDAIRESIGDARRALLAFADTMRPLAMTAPET